MSEKIFLDGEFVAPEDAKISVFDHGLLYGDGVFEGIRAYGGKVFKLQEHVTRLFDSAKVIQLTIPYTHDEVCSHIKESVKINELKDAYIRIVVTRGAGDLGLDPEKCPKASMFIIAGTITLYPKEMYENGLSIITAATRRNIPDAFNPRVKSLNYLNNIMAKIEAGLQGTPEALMLTNQGYVCECTGDNIFSIRNGRVITPPVYLGALKGITRDVAIDLAREKNLDVEEIPFTLYELYTAEEVFLTGTAAEIIPVVSIDGRAIGDGNPGPATRMLISSFRDLIANSGDDAYA